MTHIHTRKKKHKKEKEKNNKHNVNVRVAPKCDMQRQQVPVAMTRIFLFTIFDEHKFLGDGINDASTIASDSTCTLNVLTIQSMLFKYVFVLCE